MAAEPGPDFRWGALLRASKPKRVILPDGTVKVIEESTDRQDLELIHYIRDNNMGVIVDSYKDVASAWQPGAKRPRYKHALVDLAAGYIDGIACLAVDRLTRRRDQVRPILNAMEEMGGRLFFLWDELDTASDDPDTELRLHELVARAEREAERTSRRYKLVAQHRARKGLHHPSGKRAYGHARDYRGLVVEEAAMLLAAAKEVDQGRAVNAIVEEWTQQGVPTLEGFGRWHGKTLRGMLVSARMVGKREYEGALIDVEYMPAILPEELWRKVRRKLLDNPPKRGPGESRELTNIGLCGICGLPLGAQIDRAGPVYLCKKRPSQLGACGGIVILVSNLDAKVNAEVVSFLNDKQRANALLDVHKLDTPEMAAIDARFAELQDDKRALEDARFRPPLGMKRLEEERYYELLAEIEQEQERLQRRRVINRDAQPLREALGQTWTVEKWEDEALEFRRAVIRLVCERIEVRPVTRRGAAKGHLGAVHDPERVSITFSDQGA
jgi:DNA invertase Pin-like site-specific DNA recombinase